MTLSAPPSRLPRSAFALASCGGAALLVIVAARFRLDHTLCTAWPAWWIGASYGALYLVAIGLLAWAWSRGTLSPFAVVATHALALFAAPFLSSDPLMYAAVGRALSLGASPTTDITTALGATHPFLTPLPPAWRTGTSAYGPVWNGIANLIAHYTFDNLGAALRMHQLFACLAVLLGAAIVTRKKEHFALVALCPLALVEATIGAHNDALLVPIVALALVAWQRRRPIVCVLVLASGVLVKASAAIFVAPVILAMFLSVLPSARSRRVVLASVLPLSVLALVVMSHLAHGPLDAVARIVGSPDVAYDHCTRSFECLPRILFRFVLHWPFAAWATGLLFRVFGALWLAYASLRAAEAPSRGTASPFGREEGQAPREEALGWIVRGLFIYFLALHGWAQSWYVLPLLPALAYLEDDVFTTPAFRAYLVSSVCYYALVLPMSCLANPVVVAISDLVEALVTIVPPIVLLFRGTASPYGPKEGQ